jgi:hypothetical protein
MTPERLAEIRDAADKGCHAPLVIELLDHIDSMIALAKAAKDVVACHDMGSYESEGQAFDALRSAVARE